MTEHLQEPTRSTLYVWKCMECQHEWIAADGPCPECGAYLATYTRATPKDISETEAWED